MTASLTPPATSEPPEALPQRQIISRTRRWVAHGLDVLAVVALAAVLLYLADRDGGFGMSSWHLGGVVALALLPALRELWRAPTAVQAAVAAWTLGAVTALLFAADRSGFVRVTLVYALMPMVALTTAGLLRRPWGRLAVVGLLVVAFALYWQRSFMQWWGYTLGDLDTRWLPLSWHNQSAALMAVFGVFFLGVAATTKRVTAAGAGVVAAMGLAGMWLAGSRGVLVAAALGVLVAVWLGSRWQGWRRAAAVTCAVLVATVMVVGGLLAMDQGTQRVTSEQSATSNLMARVHHMEAAGGMLLDRPLTGHGLGSYATSARPYTSPEANLTIAPHNELLRPFAEGGLVFGLAVLAAAVLVGWRILRVLLAPAPRAPQAHRVRAELEAATVAGGASAAVVLLSHALVDFDWRYPVLAALLAIAAALVWAPDRERAPAPTARTPADGGRPVSRRPAWGGGLAGIGAAGIIALLAAGLWGAWGQQAVPTGNDPMGAGDYAVAHPVWDAQGNAQAAVRLLRDGEIAAAATAIERTRPWNPGKSELQALQRIVAVERGELAPQALVGAFPAYPTRLTLRNVAGEVLLRRGEHAVAQQLLDASLAIHREFRDWGVGRPVARAWELRIELAGRRTGCDQARQVAATAAAEPTLAYDENAPDHFRAYADAVCGGGSA